MGEYLAFQVGTAGWSGFGFACDPAGTATKDMSAVTGDFTLHVAMKATGTSTHCIMMEGGDGISARVAVGASSFVDGANVTAAYTDFTRDGQWHLVEIPMSEFFNKGLRYPAPMKGNVFALLSGGVAGTTISLDAIFIYRKVVSGVNDAKEDRFDIVITDKTISAPGTASGIELFDITGRKLRTSSEAIMGIENLSQGIYIVRCDNKTKKIQIK